MIRGINKNSSWIILFGFGFFSLTIYTYQAAPLLAFLFLVMIVGFNYKYFLNYRKTLFCGLVIAGLLAFPYLWTAINEPHLHERGRRIFTFSQGLNSDTITIFIRNYVSHLSYQFLFLSGDPNLRHGAKTGVLYWWMLPFIILGLILLPKSVKKRWYTGLVALWFVVFPIAGTLTNDGVPHATRTLIGAPLFCLLCGIGLWKSTLLLQHKTNSKLLVGCMLLLIFLVASIFLTIFLRRYFVAYPNQSSVWWDYGNKEVFSKVRSIEHEYRRVCLGNVNYWNEIPQREYYLQDSSLHVINNTRSPTCRRSGSIIVAKAYEKSILREGNLIHIVYNLNKRPKYYIYTVD